MNPATTEVTCTACGKVVMLDRGFVVLKCAAQLSKYSKPGQDTKVIGYVHNVGKRGDNGKLDEFVVLPLVRR